MRSKFNVSVTIEKRRLYRKFKELWDFTEIEKAMNEMEVNSDHKGFGAFRLFLCLLVQFMEDLSDRELETYIQGNIPVKWLCGFSLVEKTPDHSVFCNTRKRIGTKRLSKIFNLLRDQLKSKGYMNELFTFIDASHLISKSTLWKERDKAIKEKYDKLNLSYDF